MANTLLSIKQASEWASKRLKREISPSNISYLIQYGKVKKIEDNGKVLVSVQDLEKYYRSFRGKREIRWKDKLGHDLNWHLSFDHLREKDTTKHVHRLHPYKGKFIPQLVEYFIDSHTDEFKKDVYFKKGDIILDPFCGSGTTLVQANELGMHSIGIDVSQFNCTISKVKLLRYNFNALEDHIEQMLDAVESFEAHSHIIDFENELLEELRIYNEKHFPSPRFRYRVYHGEIDEEEFGKKRESEFLEKYKRLVAKYDVKLQQNLSDGFLDKWYVENVRREIDFTFDKIKQIDDQRGKAVLAIMLSRTIRSCRATTHYDLATLREPQLTTYYCHKHKKICKPIFSIKKMFSRYAWDTLKRLREFAKLRTDATFSLIPGDARKIDIISNVRRRNSRLCKILSRNKIRGIFTSPPYVGQIDYHEQHAYAYELFGYKRRDGLEIGPLYKGQGPAARKNYIDGVVDVLSNCRRFLARGFNIFIVANDKYNLYPTIAEKAGLKIVKEFKRPVLNRSERDKSAYAEIIFLLNRK